MVGAYYYALDNPLASGLLTRTGSISPQIEDVGSVLGPSWYSQSPGCSSAHPASDSGGALVEKEVVD